MKWLRFTFAILIFIFFSCNRPIEYDLAITDVNVFDSENKKVLEGQTILINSDTIVALVPAGEIFKAKETIQGNGRLACPGFIDTHTHLASIIGDYEKAPEFIWLDSIRIYRERIAETYLKYGVTTIKDVGQPEKWIDESLKWQKYPTPDFPNFFICGGALISDEERIPYINHVEVKDAGSAAAKIQSYHNRGIKYLKLYSRLRTDEFKAVMTKAKELDMNVCSHVEYNVPIDSALSYGMKHFEHLLTLQSSVLNSNKDWMDYNTLFNKDYGNKKSFLPSVFEAFRYIDNSPMLREKMMLLIDKMATNNATLSTTISIFASYTNRSYYRTYVVTRLHTEEVPEPLTDGERKRFNEDFDIMMKYLKIAHSKGVKIRIGTDCIDGGKAMISEMLLLFEAGFPIEDVLQIATLNGAASMDLDNDYGSIKPGKYADIILFKKDPFDNYKNFLSPKMVIKGGKVYKD